MDNNLKHKRIKNSEQYLITEFGDVINSKTGKILKPTFDGKYMKVAIPTKDGRKHLRIHRLVAEYFVPNPNNQHSVTHKNGDKTDNRSSNLEWTNNSLFIKPTPIEIAKHHTAAWGRFKKTDTFKELISSLEASGIKHPYNENVLWWAFDAGINSQFKKMI